ncbi:MAG: serine/threonine protein kinase [Phycisphaerae bacterium]|nr:serine/threonine protein kinase [Phycisphaerae bacterium]
MTEHNHEELRRLFDLAIAAPAAQRSALLARECRGDAGLKLRIEAMIAAAEDERFLASPTADLHAVTPLDRATVEASPSVPAPPFEASGGLREGPGTRIGPYKLLQLIGEGGFGSVFMAEQEKPVARKVALKIIKLGMDTRQVIARFEAERQALAMMDHPNIAKVFDAGATETGRPYFAMELCAGQPISEYCDRNNQSISERLELFAQVCTAVQHAHTKGIIHRDIKPSNVLVSTQDGRPHAKVIDFGIAKATASKLTEKTLFTELKQLIGTPEYMSPEQAEGSLDIDTRTDVYSLGVLLYELLTGSTPFSSKELRSAAFGEIQRIIREVDPPKPSTRLSQHADTLAAVAARRQTEPRKLGIAVRGELDWIVMKALEKDRARRYESANGLGMDVRRYLAGENVLAAPPSVVYRARKFVRRHRVGVAAGGVAAAALVIGCAVAMTGFYSAVRSRDAEAQARIAENAARTAAEQASQREAAQRRMAENRLRESEATVRFLDDMLGAVDPLAQGKDVTVRQVLDRAAATVSKQFQDRPLIAARLHGTIGRTLIGLGAYDAADVHVRENLAIRRRVLGAEHEDTCRAVNELGVLLVKSGAHADAESLYRQAITDHERLFGRRNEITLESIDGLATLYAMQMRPELAAPLVNEVLEGRTTLLGKDHQETVSCMNTLATMYADLCRFDESRALFENAIAIQDRISSPEHPYALEIRANYSWMQYWAAMQQPGLDPAEKRKMLQSARALGEQTLQARIRVMGEEHQGTITSMNNLANIYSELGMPVEAEVLRKKDVEVSLRTLGEEHPDTITSLSNFGSFLFKQKRFQDALPYLERALRNSRKALPPDNPGTAFTLARYGDCLRELGRFADAELPLLEARGIVVRTMGEQHPIARQMALSTVTLYEAWDRAEPGKGHDVKAAQWKATVGTDANANAEQPPPK